MELCKQTKNDEIFFALEKKNCLFRKLFDDHHDEALGLVMPETPPQQVLMELRLTPIRDDKQHEAGHKADVMVCAGRVAPAYEESLP